MRRTGTFALTGSQQWSMDPRPSIKTSMESEMESLNVLKSPCTRPCMTMRLAPPLP